MVQETYEFDGAGEKKKSAMGNVCKFIWNSDTKEFCGRDGGSWGKVSLFYAVFYTCLGSFFVGLLAIFVSVMPKDLPTYYGKSSTMNVRGINPGLGFRPQVDVEKHEIKYNPQIFEGNHGYKQYVENLDIFLTHVYKPYENDSLVVDCAHGNPPVDELKAGKSCRFDYETFFKRTDCNKDKEFGYKSDEPCVLIKMNRIVSWMPEAPSNFVTIKCDGEYARDKEFFRGATYYSETGESTTEGKIDTKYFPYFSQKEYRAPFIFARFKVEPNKEVNIECRAYADNIEVERLNKRGMTKFTLYISNHTTTTTR